MTKRKKPKFVRSSIHAKKRTAQQYAEAFRGGKKRCVNLHTGRQARVRKFGNGYAVYVRV